MLINGKYLQAESQQPDKYIISDNQLTYINTYGMTMIYELENALIENGNNEFNFFLYLKNDTERITLTYQPDAKYKYAGISYFSDEPGEWNMRGRFQLIEDKTKSKSSETLRTLKGIYLDNFFIDKLDLNLVAHSVFGKEGLLEGSESVILPLENTIENRQNNIFDFDFAQKCEIRIDIEESIDLNGNSTFYENKSNQNKESTKKIISL